MIMKLFIISQLLSTMHENINITYPSVMCIFAFDHKQQHHEDLNLGNCNDCNSFLNLMIFITGEIIQFVSQQKKVVIRLYTAFFIQSMYTEFLLYHPVYRSLQKMTFL